MSVYNRNIEALLRRFPEFDTESANPADGLNLQTTQSGDITAQYRGTYLHSNRDPRREAERIAHVAGVGTTSCVICLGFGFGYIAEYVCQHHADLPIVIIEADLRLFLSALKSRDLTDLIASESVSFLVGAELSTLPSILVELRIGTVTIIPLRSVYPHYKEYYDNAREAISTHLQRREVNKNTLARFGKLWIRNLTANLGLLAQASGITQWKGSLRGIPALIIAAGPSLDDIMPHLATLKERCVVIAVDTSLKACLTAGVEPDFVVIVDPQYWNTRHLDYCVIKNARIISESSTHPRTFRILPGERAFCGSLFPLGKYIENQLGEFGVIGAGGSVATSAWDFARYIGCSPIYCAGLDLGFPRLSTHFTGSTFEERTHTLSCRLVPQEHLAFLALRDAGPYPVVNNSGTTTLTDARLSIYQGWFESQSRLHPEVLSYNLSAYGIAIDGIPYRHVNDIRDEDTKRDIINAILSEADSTTTAGSERSGAVTRALAELTRELNALLLEVKRALEVIVSFRDNKLASSSAQEELLEQLNAIDLNIMSSGQREIAGFLVHGVATDILDSTPNTPNADPLNSSERLYSELADSIQYHLALLTRLNVNNPPNEC